MPEKNGIKKSFIRAHREIVSSIDQVQCVIRSFNKSRSKLKDFAGVLSAHLKRQDEVFDRLKDLYKEDRQASKMLEFLEVNLREIRIHLLTFMDQYLFEPGGTVERTFAKDFMGLLKEVIACLRRLSLAWM